MMLETCNVIVLTYDIMADMQKMISTVSNETTKAQDIMAFCYDIMVCLHNVLSIAPNDDKNPGYNDFCM